MKDLVQCKYVIITVLTVLTVLVCQIHKTITVLPRKERHAGISEGDHFHENGLIVLYRHASINRGMLFPEIFVLFITLPLSFKYE